MPRRKDKPRPVVEDMKIKTESTDDSYPDIIRQENRNNSMNLSKVPVIDLCKSSQESDVDRSEERTKRPPLTIELSSELSDGCSPPELSYERCLRPTETRLKRRTYLISSCSEGVDEDKPLNEVRKSKKRKLPQKDEPTTSKQLKKKNKIEKEKEKKDDKIYQIEKQPEPPALDPIPSTSAGVPKLKFNIIHADKTKKLAPAKPVKWPRNPSPPVIKFDLVPRYDNNISYDNHISKQTTSYTRKPGPRGRPGAKKKIPLIRQEATSQTYDGKINRIKDLCCDGCKKNLISQSVEGDKKEQLIFEMGLDALKKLARPKLLAIENTKVPSVVQKLTAPTTYKVPSVKTTAIMPPPKKPKCINGISDDNKNTNIELDSNTDQIDMEVEQSEITDQLPKLTFSWDKQQESSYTPTKTTPDYGPQDCLNELPQMISLIPKGSVQPKAIVKKDDLVRIGQFKELYDNPWRPKLLEVEHPPEPDDPTEKLVKSNVAFFGEQEPEELGVPGDMETELFDVLNDLSDDEQGDDAKFSDDEEDAGFSSDTGSATPVHQAFDDQQDFIIPDDDFDVVQENLLQELLINVDVGLDKPKIVEEKQNVEKEQKSQEEIQLVPPIERLQAEMTKNFNKTPLEMVDDELDFDEDDDIESPAYEDITMDEKTEDQLLKSPSPPLNEPSSSADEQESTHEPEDDPISNDIAEQSQNVQIVTDSAPTTENIEHECSISPESDRCYSERIEEDFNGFESDDIMKTPGTLSNMKSLPIVTKVPNGTTNVVQSPNLMEPSSDFSSIDSGNSSNADCSPKKDPVKRPTPTLVPVQSLYDNLNNENLNKCSNLNLRAIYIYITKSRQRFEEHFPKVVKELAVRKMSDLIMESLNVCETLKCYIHYKCIVEAMISLDFDKLIAIKLISDKQKSTTNDAIDVIIELILDHNCAEAMMSYLEKVVRNTEYSFKESSLERLVQCAINSGGNERWKSLLKDILLVGNTSTELTNKIINCLKSGETQKKIEDEPTPKKKPLILVRTVTNNKYVKPVKQIPDLLPVVKPK